MNRRGLLAGLLGLAASAIVATAPEAEAARRRSSKKKQVAKRPKRAVYAGRKLVPFTSREKPGTIIIRTSERELIMETADALEVDRDEAADLVRKLAPG